MYNNYYNLFLDCVNKINFYNNYNKSVKCYFTNDNFIILTEDKEKKEIYKLIINTNQKISYFVNNKLTVQSLHQAEYYVADSYGRRSKTFTSEVVTYTPYSPRPAITISYADSGVLITEVRDDTETNAVPRRYAISYDNGKTWSNWQLGRYFQKLKPSTGTYWIRVKIKYTTGVESNSVGKMVTIK